MIIIIIISPRYGNKLQPVVEFRLGTMRLHFTTTTSRSPLGKVVVPFSLSQGPEIVGGNQWD